MRGALGSAAGSFLLHLLVVKLLISEGQFLLRSGNLLHELTLVEGLLGNDLPTQVLDLGSQSLLDRIVLLAHDLSPDSVELVQDLTNAGFSHLALVVISDLENGANSLGWDPVVVLLLFGAFWGTLGRVIGC